MVNWNSNSLTVSKIKRYIKCTISSKRWRSITRIHGTKNLRWSYIAQKMRKMLSLMSYVIWGHCWQFTITFINKTQQFYCKRFSLVSCSRISLREVSKSGKRSLKCSSFRYVSFQIYCGTENYLFFDKMCL